MDLLLGRREGLVSVSPRGAGRRAGASGTMDRVRSHASHPERMPYCCPEWLWARNAVQLEDPVRILMEVNLRGHDFSVGWSALVTAALCQSECGQKLSTGKNETSRLIIIRGCLLVWLHVICASSLESGSRLLCGLSRKSCLYVPWRPPNNRKRRETAARPSAVCIACIMPVVVCMYLGVDVDGLPPA